MTPLLLKLKGTLETLCRLFPGRFANRFEFLGGSFLESKTEGKAEDYTPVDVSLLESLMHNMDGAFEYYNNLGEVPRHGGRNGF